MQQCKFIELNLAVCVCTSAGILKRAARDAASALTVVIGLALALALRQTIQAYKH